MSFSSLSLFLEHSSIGAFQEIKDLYTHYVDTRSHYHLLVSGGPDSMYMAHSIFYYFFTTGLDLSRLHIRYIDHHQRPKEVQKEKEFLAHYFAGYNFSVLSLGHTQGGASEHVMRIERIKIYKSIMKRYGDTNNVFVTGHHLSDRVETQFLHQMRGCELGGLINMVVDDQYQEISLLRPLLTIPKSTLEERCAELTIPFFVDTTNTDPSYTPRNAIREKIASFLALLTPLARTTYRQDRNKTYAYLENIYTQQTTIVPVCPLIPSKFRGVEKYFVCRLPTSPTEVLALWKYLGIARNVSRPTLEEFADFFATKHSGWKRWQGRYFIISHSKLYLLKKSNIGAFWQAPSSLVPRTIKSVGSVQYGDFERDISNPAYIGAILRMRVPGDVFKGKKVTKYLINQKIPVLWRNICPLLEKDGQIVAIYPLWKEVCVY